MSKDCERCAELAERVDSLETIVDSLVDDLGSVDDAVADTDAAVESLAQRVSDLEARQAAKQSDKESRTDELRDVLARKARANGARAWSYRDIRDELLTLGYGEFSKPVYYDHMDALAERQAFETTTKVQTVAHGDSERTATVEAVGVDPDQLPPEPSSNPVTTGGMAADGGEQTTQTESD